MEGFGWYTFEICKRLVENHPEHEFVFFFDRPYDEQFVFGKNVTPVVLFPPARHPFLFLLFFEIAIPRALNKHKIDVFFSPDGYLSLFTKVQQIATIHDINFEHFPKDIPLLARRYLRYFFPKFAKKASRIITVSEYSKKDIIETYKVPADKITAIWNGASDTFKPISAPDKNEIREEISSGNPYFLFVGSLHPRKNLKRLLLAFELFLKENPSSKYELVIVGAALWKEEKLDALISAEIFNRIHFKGHLPLNELNKIVGAASIFIYIPYFEGFGIPLVEAMQCGVPIISGNLTSLPEVAGETALYCDPLSVTDIAEKMTLLSSDIELQNKLSQKGLERSREFSWDKAAELVWELIVKE
jgi:glycosyltransferase involved in cell wall biosynthesis